MWFIILFWGVRRTQLFLKWTSSVCYIGALGARGPLGASPSPCLVRLSMWFPTVYLDQPTETNWPTNQPKGSMYQKTTIDTRVHEIVVFAALFKTQCVQFCATCKCTNTRIQTCKKPRIQTHNLSPPHVLPNNMAFELQSPNEKGPVNKEKDILLNLHKRLRLFYLGIYSLSAHNTVIGWICTK